jgi:hypothetical protein
MGRPHYRTQQEILDRIYDAIKRGDQGDEFNEYMRCARFVPIALRSVYEDTVEADWMVDHENAGKAAQGLISPVVCDDACAIDHTAKALLLHFQRALHPGCGPNRRATVMRQYRAFKWLLGHEDADTFLGLRPDPYRVYTYLMKQIKSGEWDRMTLATKRRRDKARQSRENARYRAARKERYAATANT